MYKVIASDFDGVIKPYYDPVPPELSEILRKISQKFYLIILSGRQAEYLDGVICGMGIKPDNVAIVAEEGTLVFYPSTYTHEIVLNDDELKDFNKAKKTILKIIDKKYKNKVIVVPTHIILTIVAGEQFKYLREDIENSIREQSLENTIKLVFHKHHNVIQVVPAKADKYRALEKILKKQGYNKSEVIGIGDGLNDLPILYNVGLPIGIGSLEEIRLAAKVRFRNGFDAFKYIHDLYM
ncbi:MAG: HAD family hydrolase [Candidatus Njordarchaeia archaeon]